MKNFVKNYLQFSKKERWGMIILFVLIALFILFPILYQPPQTRVYTDSLFYPVNQATASPSSRVGEEKIEPNKSTKPFHLFSFDPNFATAQQWEELGLTEQNIRTIFNYKAKGGRFKQASDLQKIWGIRKEDAARLIPYAHIEPTTLYNTNYAKYQSTRNYSKPSIPIIDINTASLENWEALPGIGPVLAARIIKFRDKIGGFSELVQVQKTYGISDSLFKLIQPFLKLGTTEGNPLQTKPNINLATLAQLIKAEIPEDIAKAIVLYRKQYGPFTSITDLKKIVFINEQLFEQISPKLTVQ